MLSVIKVNINPSIMKDKFIKAIHDKKKINVTYFAKKYGENITRLCAPMDFAPGSKSKDKSDKFHFWDYESTNGRHTTSIMPDEVVDIEVTEFSFEPSDFVNWATNWSIPRDWGKFS